MYARKKGSFMATVCVITQTAAETTCVTWGTRKTTTPQPRGWYKYVEILRQRLSAAQGKERPGHGVWAAEQLQRADHFIQECALRREV